jgi:hypothetical protein
MEGGREGGSEGGAYPGQAMVLPLLGRVVGLLHRLLFVHVSGGWRSR